MRLKAPAGECLNYVDPNHTGHPVVRARAGTSADRNPLILYIVAPKLKSGFVIDHYHAFKNGTDVLRHYTLMFRVGNIGLQVLW